MTAWQTPDCNKHAAVACLVGAAGRHRLAVAVLADRSTDLSLGGYNLVPLPLDRIGGRLRLGLAPVQQTRLRVLDAILCNRPGIPIIAATWSPPGWIKTVVA